MSAQAFGWVLDHSPAKGTDRLILLSIANHAGKSPVDGAWTAYPGIETLRQEAGLDRGRTVQDALARLVKAGHLLRIINGCPDERIAKDRRPNLYSILLDNGVTCGDTRCCYCPLSDGVTPDAERGDAAASDGVTPERETGCRDASPKPKEQPSVQPKGEPNTLALVLADAPATPERDEPKGHRYTAIFLRWYPLYPRQTGKLAASRKHAVAVKAVGEERLNARTRAWADYWEVTGTEMRFIPYPATFLHQGQYETEPPAVDLRSEKQRRFDAVEAKFLAEANGHADAIPTTATEPLPLEAR